MAIYLIVARRLGAFEALYAGWRLAAPGSRSASGPRSCVSFLWIPLVIIMVYAFNSSNIQSWPLPGLSTKWFPVAWHDPQVHTAFWLSIKAGLAATVDRARARLAARRSRSSASASSAAS